MLCAVGSLRYLTNIVCHFQFPPQFSHAGQGVRASELLQYQKLAYSELRYTRIYICDWRYLSDKIMVVCNPKFHSQSVNRFSFFAKINSDRERDTVGGSVIRFFSWYYFAMTTELRMSD